MIDGVLSLKTTPCANGQTFEYRLFHEHDQIGRSVFLAGNRSKERALGQILSHLIENRDRQVAR